MLAKKEKGEGAQCNTCNTVLIIPGLTQKWIFNQREKCVLLIFLNRLGHVYIQHILIAMNSLNGKGSVKQQLVFYR